jgi:peptidoglycan hydrolase-like protein with peptidoglycan-binding domain
MKKFLGVLALSAMLAVPLAVVAAGADNTTGNLPPAVDQLLARDMVQQAQLYLKTAGFNPGRADGIFDAQTSGAVRQYQAANGIPASGMLDEPTRSVMFPGFDSAAED